MLAGMADHLPEAHAVLRGAVDEALQRRVADAADGIVDDAAQGLAVVGIDDQAEVGQDVLDLLALVEGQSAVYYIRYGPLAQFVLETAALGVGAVEDGEGVILAAVLALDAVYLLGYHHGLLLVAVAGVVEDAVALGLLGIDLLGDLSPVVLHERAGRTDDVARGAVVALQLEEAGEGKLLLEVENVVDIGAAEGVDALVVVADDTDALVALREQLHDADLHGVGVLVLIDQDVAEEAGVLAPRLGMVAQEEEGVDQQVVEVHGVGLEEAGLVGGVDLGDRRHTLLAVALAGGLVVGILGGEDEVVLRHGDATRHRGGLIDLVVEAQFLEDQLDQAPRVAVVVDGEVGLVAQRLALLAQDAREDGVERAHIESAGLLVAHDLGHALLHLPCGLVGEGQGQDVPGVQARREKVGYLVGQDAGLARSCAGYHQRGAVAIGHGFALAVVELG